MSVKVTIETTKKEKLSTSFSVQEYVGGIFKTDTKDPSCDDCCLMLVCCTPYELRLINLESGNRWDSNNIILFQGHTEIKSLDELEHALRAKYIGHYDIILRGPVEEVNK